MDRREPGRLTLSAPPNCKVDFGDASPRDFTARWIRGAARLDPPGLVRSAERLSRRQGLVSELLSSLSLVGTPEAKDAILRLALDSYLTSPEAALEALSRLGAHSCLLEVARSDRPLPLRERALTLLGYDGAASSLTELRTMALTTPEPSLRKLAFRALSALDDPAAIAVIPGAVDDRELKEGALSWLDRLPTESSQHVLLQLLEHPDHRVRSRAILLLSAPRDSLSRKKSGNTPQNDLLLPLALRLLSGKRETREAALAVILSRGELGRLPGILGRIFQTAQPSASLVRVRQTAEMLFKDYARIAAGLREAAGRLLAGASRIFSDAVEMESAPK